MSFVFVITVVFPFAIFNFWLVKNMPQPVKFNFFLWLQSNFVYILFHIFYCSFAQNIYFHNIMLYKNHINSKLIKPPDKNIKKKF